MTRESEIFDQSKIAKNHFREIGSEMKKIDNARVQNQPKVLKMNDCRSMLPFCSHPCHPFPPCSRPVCLALCLLVPCPSRLMVLPPLSCLPGMLCPTHPNHLGSTMAGMFDAFDIDALGTLFMPPMDGTDNTALLSGMPLHTQPISSNVLPIQRAASEAELAPASRCVHGVFICAHSPRHCILSRA